MRRTFRGYTYRIAVSNPAHLSRWVTEIRLDGCSLEGNLIPPVGDGGSHNVEVIMSRHGE